MSNEYPLKLLSDLTRIKSDDYLIPGNCYQTWEDNRFGTSHISAIENFRNLNPTISWFLFTNTQRDEYMESFWVDEPIHDIYKRAKFGVIKADIFRYCILFERGGYYFDISKGCNTPLRALHQHDTKALISFENNLHDFKIAANVANTLLHPQHLILQWGFGFAAQNHILRKVIDQIVEDSVKFSGVVYEDPKTAIWNFTGPIAFTRAVHSNFDATLFEFTEQAGIDFNLTGILPLPGAYTRHFKRRNYWDFKNKKILKMATK